MLTVILILTKGIKKNTAFLLFKKRDVVRTLAVHLL